MKNKYTDKYIKELTLDWINNFLTFEKFAKHYGLTDHEASLLVKKGRKLLEIDRIKAIKNSLEYLRKEIRKERISYSEIAELQDLIPYIEKDDVELLEWAGVPEFTD